MTKATGADLERWRIENGLSKSEAAEAFGIQPVKWDKLTTQSALSEEIYDPIIVMLLTMYTTYPESSPITPPPTIQEFFDWLGLSVDEPNDLSLFATLIGRSWPSVYRILVHHGNPGRPITKWMEAVLRLHKAKGFDSAIESKKIMMNIIKSAGDRQGVDDVLINGWEGWTKRRDDAK